jgi:hypothetical protein
LSRKKRIAAAHAKMQRGGTASKAAEIWNNGKILLQRDALPSGR